MECNQIPEMLQEVQRHSMALVEVASKPQSWQGDAASTMELASQFTLLSRKVAELGDRIGISSYSGPNLSMGELARRLGSGHPDATVMFEDGLLPERFVRSYQGMYRHVALGSETGKWGRSAREMSKMLYGSIGAIKTGSNGEEHYVFADTPVWRSDYGQSSGLAIIDVVKDGDKMVILTSKIDC